MQFSSPLFRGTLIKRYKRFMADVTLENGEEITAHVANSGSMLGLNRAGMEVWLSQSDNPKRKLKYSWELVRDGDGLVGINTMPRTFGVLDGPPSPDNIKRFCRKRKRLEGTPCKIGRQA